MSWQITLWRSSCAAASLFLWTSKKKKIVFRPNAGSRPSTSGRQTEHVTLKNIKDNFKIRLTNYNSQKNLQSSAVPFTLTVII